jgi:hypothetical protein
MLFWEVNDDANPAQECSDPPISLTAMEEPPCSSCEFASIFPQS